MPVVTCNSGRLDIGGKLCNADYGQIEAVWAVNSGEKTGISLVDALVESNWDAEFNKSLTERVIPIRRADVATREKEEDIRNDDGRIPNEARKGRQSLIFTYRSEKGAAYELFKTWDKAEVPVYFITSNGGIIGGGDGGTNLIPVDVKFFVTEPMAPEGKDGFWEIQIRVDILPYKDYFVEYVVPVDKAADAWNPLDKTGIEQIYAVISGISTGGFTAALTSLTYREVEVTAPAVTGDFLIIDPAGSSVAYTAVLGADPNIYIFTATLSGSTTYKLRMLQPTATTDGYELQDTDIVVP